MDVRGGAPGRRTGVAAVVLLVLGAVLSCAGGIGGYFFMPTKVMTSGHMGPSHPAGSSMVFNLLITKVERGDVVLFDAAAWGERHLSVERVVAVGGDHLAYAPGDRTFTLNGKPLAEPYVLDGDPVAGTPGAFSVTVPEGRMFLMGDTRGNSADSRYRYQTAPHGTVPESDVKGAVIDDGDPLLVGLRSLVLCGIPVLLAGVWCGVVAARQRRRAAASAAASVHAWHVPPGV
ncbi:MULTISPECIES: signal peptidase I [unclassified Streptomyces]|uniref:signal peptidase I n=1 Tax=unclassified Streptomyces TaxID=2593676 RepID=UPI001EF8A221|nr:MULTISPECIES: signal peptidase I [unclassified Streptomyces]